MFRPALRVAIAGAVLLAAPLAASAGTYYGGYTMHAHAPSRGYAPMRGYGYRPVARGYGYGRRVVRRYGVGARVGAIAAAVGYGAGYGYGTGYGYGAGYGAAPSYGYGTASYATGPSYAPQPAAYNCPPPQPVSTIAYVPVTTYKAVRVYYAPQQPPYYSVPPYALRQ